MKCKMLRYRARLASVSSGREYYLLTTFHMSTTYGLVCTIRYKTEKEEKEEEDEEEEIQKNPNYNRVLACSVLGPLKILTKQ